MKCLDVQENIIDMLSDEISPEVRAAVLEHIRDCPVCREEYSCWMSAFNFARIPKPKPVPASFKRRTGRNLYFPYMRRSSMKSLRENSPSGS